MNLEYQIIAAFLLDLLVGDPRWLPHPVRIIGWLAQRLESASRKIFRSQYIAGSFTAVMVISLTALSVYGLVRAANYLSPLAGDVLSILLIYTTIAARDLVVHSNAVYKALTQKDLEKARHKVAMIVGRDTDNLSESEITRAAVESVAENTADGITAPLFYAIIAGPIGALLYRAVNTLDSIFGYKNERYMKFGRFSAKIDDIVNFIPARLTALVMCLVAGFLRLQTVNAFKILIRDCRNHTSPNAGFPEAATAGALGVRLGGVNYYFGQPSQKPTIGEPIEPLTRGHIKKANMLMLTTSVVFLGLAVFLRQMTITLWQMWSTAT